MRKIKSNNNSLKVITFRCLYNTNKSIIFYGNKWLSKHKIHDLDLDISNYNSVFANIVYLFVEYQKLLIKDEKYRHEQLNYVTEI